MPTPRLFAAIAGIAVAGVVVSGCGSATPHGELSMGDDNFTPLMLTVAPGATVTVANPSSQTHNVVVNGGSATPGGLVKTMAIKPDGSTSFQAPTTPGTYRLTCDFHVDMMATLVVS